MTGAGGALPEVILRHRGTTNTTVDRLEAAIWEEVGDQADAVIGDHTTFILTGSAGRGEMTEGSDVDGYVVRVGEPLDRHHDALLLCAMFAALEKLGLPPLDRGGEFQAMKTGTSLVDCLGSTRDDATNALTTRMLFLLEGRPLVGKPAYDALSLKVQEAYRGTAADHADDFLPFFLVNDIIRYWRTVLLNHEERLRKKKKDLTDDEGLKGDALHRELLAHRRYRSQKLRFPRCLTCFSALAYILAIIESGERGVSAEAEQKMFALTPLERMQRIGTLKPGAQGRIDEMLRLYGQYLGRSDGAKDQVIRQLRDDESFAATASREGQQFTEEMFHLIQELGGGSRLHRQMLI